MDRTSGPLLRESLRLGNIVLPEKAERMAWLAHYLPQIPGSGIIYTLTKNDAETLASWLQSRAINALLYHADSQHREQLDEQGGTWAGALEALKKGQIPIYVKAFGEPYIGNRKLIESGAYEFPAGTFNNLRELFSNSPRSLMLFDKGGQPIESQTTEAAVQARLEIASDIQPGANFAQTQLRVADETYNRFLEILQDLVAQPLDLKTISTSITKKLDVHASRARALLKRAVEEGVIHKTKSRPARYVRLVSEHSLCDSLQEIEGESKATKGKGHTL